MSYTIPGTGIDIIELIVMKEKSSMLFQIIWINTEKRKLNAMNLLIFNYPSLKVWSNPANASEIYGGIYLIEKVYLGSFVSNFSAVIVTSCLTLIWIKSASIELDTFDAS